MSGQGFRAAPRIAVLDYGMGNLRSVEKAFEHVGAEAVISNDRETIRTADGIVLPGVGAFAKAIERIGELELDRLIHERVENGTAVLGICLGFQLLFDSSTELGGAAGLGLIEGEVTGLQAPGLKIPHIGWEPVSWTRPAELCHGIAAETPFYFVHGFTPRPTNSNDVLATAVHGERFACAIARPPIYGVQFHPEKSSAVGLRLLANFARLARARGTSGLTPADAGPPPARAGQTPTDAPPGPSETGREAEDLGEVAR